MFTSSVQSLRMRCSIERDTGGSDPFGGSSAFVPVAENVRCLWWVTSGRELIDDVRSVVVADENVMFASGTDVREGDRIVGLLDEQRRPVFDGFREVEHVSVRRQHVVVSVRSSR